MGLDDAGTLNALLDCTVREDGQPWLLIGDSVLAGDTIASKTRDWQDKRVVDFMNSERADGAEQRFYQAALDGLLPVDAEQIVRQLDRLDPAANVSVCIELNMRFFSKYYAAQNDCSRPWLSDLAPSVIDEEGFHLWDWLRSELHALSTGAGRYLPIYRHRRKLPVLLPAAIQRQLMGANPEAPPANALEGQARLLEHYREWDLSDDSAQVRAIRAIVRRAAIRGRTVRFFVTPLNDNFMRKAQSTESYGREVAAISALIDTPARPQVSLINLDHPIFGAEYFIDHCHMLPEGNRLLAINLLHELNVGLARLPGPHELVYSEDEDWPIVWNAGQGFVDGPAWSAAFNSPSAICFAGSGRAIVADTGNNCLRELAGNFQTVRTLGAGVLRAPTCLAASGDVVYFADQQGTVLKRWHDGRFATEYILDGPAWRDIRAVRVKDRFVYVLDGDWQILRYDPGLHMSEQVLRVGTELRMKTFDVSPSGLFYVVDTANRIWEAPDVPGGWLFRESPRVRLLFPNEGSAWIPKNATWPFDAKLAKLYNIANLRYVDRYNGLLIQDEAPPTANVLQITERVHLVFLRLKDGYMYPWIKPQTLGTVYLDENVHADYPVTPFHVGCLDIDQPSAAMIFAEKGRSRICLYNDGIWGAARVAHSPASHGERGTMSTDPFGPYAGEQTQASLRPNEYIRERIDRIRRTGPYVAIVAGSSLFATSDVVSQYSLGRKLERELQYRLGLRDGIQFQLVVRMRPGMRFEEGLDVLKEHYATGMRADLLGIDATFAGGDSAIQAEALMQLNDLARLYDSVPVVCDFSGIMSEKSEGLQGPVPPHAQFLNLAQELGLVVIAPTNTLLRDHIGIAPWGSPPYRYNHAAPWAIDATANLMAEMLYPAAIHTFLRRPPAVFQRQAELLPAVDTTTLLSAALVAVGPDVMARSQRVFPGDCMQRSLQGRALTIYVDIGKLGPSEDSIDTTAAAALVHILSNDPAAGIATSLRLILARFDNYDEYGVGVKDSSTVLFDRKFEKDDVVAYLSQSAGSK